MENAESSFFSNEFFSLVIQCGWFYRLNIITSFLVQFVSEFSGWKLSDLNVDASLFGENGFDFLQQLAFDGVGYKSSSFWCYLFGDFVDIHISAILFDNVTGQQSHLIVPTTLGQSQTQKVF